MADAMKLAEVIETLAGLLRGPRNDDFDRGAWAARLDALDMLRPLASPPAPAREDRIGTHSPTCWSFGPRHYECALSEIERLRAREEAPAEGAGERADIIQWQKDQREFFQSPVLEVVTEYARWRDRTSEPEAGAAVVKAICQHCQRATVVPPETLALAHPAPSESDDRLRVAVEALEKIERWFGEFPETGRNWPNDDGSDSDRPMSYAAVNGSNGERDYMRSVARQALPALTEGGE